MSLFRRGKIWWKCWQDISRGGNFHDTAPISLALKTRKLPPREKFPRLQYLHFQLKLSSVIKLWGFLIQETTEDSMTKFQNLQHKGYNQMLTTEGQTSSIHIQNKSCQKTTKFAERQPNLNSNILCSNSKFKVRVTRSKIIVWCERFCQKEIADMILQSDEKSWN